MRHVVLGLALYLFQSGLLEAVCNPRLLGRALEDPISRALDKPVLSAGEQKRLFKEGARLEASLLTHLFSSQKAIAGLKSQIEQMPASSRIRLSKLTKEAWGEPVLGYHFRAENIKRATVSRLFRLLEKAEAEWEDWGLDRARVQAELTKIKEILDLLVERNFKLVLGFLKKRGFLGENAEEVVKELYGVSLDEMKAKLSGDLIRLVTGFDPYFGTTFSTYAYSGFKTSLRELYNKNEKESRVAIESFDGLWDTVRAPGDGGLGGTHAERFRALLSVLPEDLLKEYEPQILFSFYVEGVPMKEIARRLDLTLSNAKSKKVAALSRIRGKLERSPELLDAFMAEFDARN